jgi:hypothetical protein
LWIDRNVVQDIGHDAHDVQRPSVAVDERRTQRITIWRQNTGGGFRHHDGARIVVVIVPGDATSGDRPILLRREGDVGHGARALSRTVALTVDTLTFAARWTGLAVD